MLLYSGLFFFIFFYSNITLSMYVFQLYSISLCYFLCICPIAIAITQLSGSTVTRRFYLVENCPFIVDYEDQSDKTSFTTVKPLKSHILSKDVGFLENESL